MYQAKYVINMHKTLQNIYFNWSNSIFSLPKLRFYILYITVAGVVENVQQKGQVKQTWCARSLPNQKPGKCVIEECESKCRQKWKGNGTQATCRHGCTCHFCCPWLQVQP